MEIVEAGWLQAEQQSISSNGSAVPALGSNSRSNIWSSVYQLIIKSQAYWRDYLSDLGSSTVQASGGDNRHIGAIGWSMYCIYIGTIIVCVGSSTVLAIGSFR
jgi:hypothetical protein